MINNKMGNVAINLEKSPAKNRQIEKAIMKIKRNLSEYFITAISKKLLDTIYLSWISIIIDCIRFKD